MKSENTSKRMGHNKNGKESQRKILKSIYGEETERTIEYDQEH